MQSLVESIADAIGPIAAWVIVGSIVIAVVALFTAAIWLPAVTPETAPGLFVGAIVLIFVLGIMGKFVDR